MTNRQIDNKTTKQIRINAQIHQQLKVATAQEGKSIKAFIEELLKEIGIGGNE